jgi:nucleotide-binding universal stress UspA family protein
MPWLPKRCVVVPVDFSADSLAAVDTALAMVAAPNCLHVIHVLSELGAGEAGIAWGTIDPAFRKEAVEKALHEQFQATRYRGVDFVVDIGDPAHEIADFARSVGAELIVLPSHGRTGIARWLIGSTSERVVRLAHCPVLVLRK